MENIAFLPTGEVITTFERLKETSIQPLAQLLKENGQKAYQEGYEQGKHNAVKYILENYSIISKEELTSISKQFITTSKGRKKGLYKLSEHDRQQVYRLHRQNVSNRQIADAFGICEKTVRNYIKMEQ